MRKPATLSRRALALLAALLFPVMTAHAQLDRDNPSFPAVDLRETVRPSALRDLRTGGVPIAGRVRSGGASAVTIRVTIGHGRSFVARLPVKDGRFRGAYPRDFRGAPRLAPCVLYVDATAGDRFDGTQAEATVNVYDGRRLLAPDFPSPFTTDLRDSRGRTDAAAAEWPATRALVNLYMRSRGAKLAGVGRADFDLARPADLDYFRDSLALYDFDHRDRDWSRPLGHRVRRAFWQSVWDTWFNASNDHPLDGNPANNAPSNFMPYAFANDFADILIQHVMRTRLRGSTEDNLPEMVREATENLLAMQHRAPENFARTDTRGKRETYTAGAFRYGLFVDGEFMTEGRGWFYNPAFLDYIAGGNLNGRAVWGMGEALRADPKGPLAPELKAALALALRFCLRDALAHGYAKETPQGRVYWRDAGEHAYLALGMVNACAAAPDLPVPIGKDGAAVTLRAACADALDALADLQQPHGQWAVYPNTDSVAIAALAEGALTMKDHPQAPRWRRAAQDAADAWMAAKVDPAEFRGTPVHFGLRLTPDTMTYRWHKLAPDAWADRNYLFFYQTGHWIHALARLHALTGETRYRLRAEEMTRYLCGDNPWGVRLLNEMGGVYNWVEDRDGDGIEDHLKQDMYPESTAFSLIGIFHLLHTRAEGR